MMKSTILRGGLLLVTLLFALVPSVAQQSGRGDYNTRAALDAPAATDRAHLRDVAETRGVVSVIVGLVTDRPGRMAFDSMSVQAQAAVIAQTQDALLAELSLTRSDAGVRRYSSFPMLALDVTPEQLAVLEESGLVDYVQESRFRELSMIEATQNIGMKGVDGAWALGATGHGQTVVVLDSGVERTHPFLLNKVVAEACYSTTANPVGFTVTSVCPPGPQFALGSAAPCNVIGGQCEHGTHIAGIIAGAQNPAGDEFNGVAPDAELIAMQVFSKATDGTQNVCFRAPGTNGPNDPGYPHHECILAADPDIIAALDRVYDVLRHEYSIAAVNMSFGSELFTSQAACDAALPAYRTAIKRLVNNGIAVVSSSGNQARTDSMNAPACITGVISVGATCDTNYPQYACLADQIAVYTNAAPFLSLLAPGANIDSSVSGNSYGQKSGTSQAAAIVSGAFAAIKDYRSGASNDQILQALKASAVLVDDPGTLLNDAFPLIRVDDALDMLIFPDQPTLLEPDANASFAQGPITFKWSAGEDTTRYVLEMFNANGNNRLANVVVQHGDCEADAGYPDEEAVCTADIDYDFVDDKTYQWQVVARNSNNNTRTNSERRPFQFDTPGAAPLLTPVNKVVINQPTDLVEFQWEEVELADSYRLTMFDKKNGAVKISTPPLDENAVCNLDGICTYTATPDDQATLRDDRTYKWYVTSISDDGTSKSKVWTIKAKMPAPPQLTSPIDKHVFTNLDDIALTWTEVAGADEYRIKIFDTGKTKAVINEQLVLEARSIGCLSGVCTFVPSAQQRGVFKNKHNYRWSVTASNEVGSNTSAELTFKTKFPAPPTLISPVSPITIQDPTITFTFGLVPDADSYQLFVVLKSNGNKVIQRGLTPGGNLTCGAEECSYILSAAEAGKLKNKKTYRWYVKSVSEAGKNASAKWEFTIQSPLPPTLISPAADVKLHSRADASFSWTDVGTGATYKLVLKDTKTGKNTVKTNIPGVNCTSGTCSYTLDAGQQNKLQNSRDYRWWVVAKNSTGKSKSAKLILKTEFPRAPKPLSPVNNTTLNAAEDLTELSWQSGGIAGPVDYRLRIKRVDNGNLIYDATFAGGTGLTCDSDQCTLAVPQEVRDALRNKKNYKWWVIATSADGSKAGKKFTLKARF